MLRNLEFHEHLASHRFVQIVIRVNEFPAYEEATLILNN